jgi:Cdc6-like AAA superfamily ATPase
MMATEAMAEEIYNQVIKSLPPAQRLKLAAMILNDIPAQAIVDYSEAWSDEDVRDFNSASWNDVLQQVEEEETDANGG